MTKRGAGATQLEAWACLAQARAPSPARSAVARRSSARRCPSTPTRTASSTSAAASAVRPTLLRPPRVRRAALFVRAGRRRPVRWRRPAGTRGTADPHPELREFGTRPCPDPTLTIALRAARARQRDGRGANGLPAADHDAAGRARGEHHEAHDAGAPRPRAGPVLWLRLRRERLRCRAICTLSSIAGYCVVLSGWGSTGCAASAQPASYAAPSHRSM